MYVFGFLDGSSHHICRPDGPGHIQNALYNAYYHSHCIIWQGCGFPDGMVVLDGPDPGYKTDPMVWRDCFLKIQLTEIMEQRVAAGLPRLKLYTDKIYNTDEILEAAYSRRFGALQPYMRVSNRIMSGIRIGIEWTFGLITTTFKFLTLKSAQKIQQNQVPKFYYVAALFSNARVCLYGSPQHMSAFQCQPPTIEEYFSQ
jgi:hypothetical protein